MMQFYGLSLSEIENMPYHRFDSLYRAITVIDAQETLKQLKIVSFPNMKKEDRKVLHKTLHRQAYPDAHDRQKTVSMEDAVKLLSRVT